MVEIVATELCSRYSARIIRNLNVRPSPEWLARRLELVGVRSINNVADATNYVLMACGHPMHAFDMDRLQGGKILVRRAAAGERLTTLDGIDRSLTQDDLVIADARNAVALAGVMGGRDSEISSETRNVLLESAWFEPVAVRRTAKRQALHTEASHRFERGADLEATLVCADRCIELIQQLAGGEPDPTPLDAFPKPHARPSIVLRRWELERHLGVEIPPEEVEGILVRLGFAPRVKGRAGWTCHSPSHRVDVSREIDLVEEVARHYGYDRFPLRLPAGPGQATHRPPHAEKEEQVRRLLLALGYDETISSPIVSREAAGFGEASPVALANPQSEEGAALRTSLIPNLLSALQWNLHRGRQTVALFEIGKAYQRHQDGFQEPALAVIAATGDRVAATLSSPAKEFDFFDLKGDIEQTVQLFDAASLRADAEHLPPHYRPGHCARLLAAGQPLARFGQLHAELAERWKFRRPVFIAELFLERLYSLNLHSPQAQPLSRYPAVDRDFSVVLPDTATYETVQQLIASLQIPELQLLRPVEVFRGGPIPPGHYSLLLRLTLQSNETTLNEADLAERSARIMTALERQLGATIRKGE
jgi:phenylalanyl-tRNA synthetase beta chain